uniref:Putative ovule protein n=1 Tax=Solanum chacoense TaxID=4108 RepID=A0A0V0HB86_SOLCH
MPLWMVSQSAITSARVGSGRVLHTFPCIFSKEFVSCFEVVTYPSPKECLFRCTNTLSQWPFSCNKRTILPLFSSPLCCFNLVLHGRIKKMLRLCGMGWFQLKV